MHTRKLWYALVYLLVQFAHASLPPSPPPPPSRVQETSLGALLVGGGLVTTGLVGVAVYTTMRTRVALKSASVATGDAVTEAFDAKHFRPLKF